MIGKVIQQKRKDAKLTQAQLAERLGVTAPAVNRWEKDLSFPDAALLAPLARCLKTDLNELFSFYDSLSDKERELIVAEVRELLLDGNNEEALQFIEDTVKQNLSDGQLYKDLAESLYGFYVFTKASGSTISLEKVTEYYERAWELLPDDKEAISYTLFSLYAEMGNAEKAQAAWDRLPETAYDKQWAHAEMLYLLKDYTSAIPEFEECILRSVIDLSLKLDLLSNTLSLNGDAELTAIAKEKAAELRNLFGLWDGFDMMSRITGAVTASDADAEASLLSDFVNMTTKDETISTCPLFANVALGGVSKEESSSADLMSDLLHLLKDKFE